MAMSVSSLSFVLRHAAFRFRAPAWAASTSLTRTLTTSAPNSSAVWRERVQQWQATLALAETGDASALCDVGWAKHKGLVPSPSSTGEVGGKAVTEAVACYKQSASLGYAPASSLLGDLYFYGQDEPKDLVKARRHLEKVLEDTTEGEGDDAYVRVRALRKLGSIAMWGDDSDLDSISARDSFSRALTSCQTHLGGNFAFLLSHDPPAFYSHLEEEMKITDDPQDLGGKLSGFTTAKGWEPKLDHFVTLRAFTRRLRDTEKSDVDFALDYFQEAEGLRRSETSGECEWGITFLPSMFRVYGHPLLQKLLKEKAEKNDASDNSNKQPSVLVLGSALGNCAVWPALAFGFKATGFDILESCVQKTNAIIGSLKGKGAETLRDLTRFEAVNVISQSDLVGREMKEASVVWSNDHEWGQAAQCKIEEMAFENMTEGSCLVLYRPPLTLHKLGWKNGVQIPNIAVSWNPKLTMYLLLK